MSKVPEDLLYTEEHEWLRIHDDEVVIGITYHAQEALTDIVYIELPEPGDRCEEMDEFAVVESVKSASPIFAPLAGEVTAVNDALDDSPEAMNEDPYGSGWIIRLRPDDISSTEGMMSASEYRSLIE